MKTLFLSMLVCICYSSCTTYYYVVRHADRLDNSDHSPLSEIGFTRAEILRDNLFPKGIDSIFASTYIRTQQTARPLATKLRKSIRIYDKDTTPALISALKRISGKDVLIVGHSDNVPTIVFGLSGKSIPAITHEDFDNLYVIKIYKFGNTKRTLWHKAYGPPSPAP
ncbi:phosphoglycerate mutase family protein [Flavitalea sp.]|nr:phosphoglycerate mutase family protein [Flavitalea sp.]